MTEDAAVADATVRINARNVDSILAFLETKINRNELGEGAGNPLVTAVKRMLDVGEDVPVQPLDELNVDDLFERFTNKNRAKLTDGSATAYKNRFRRALTMYSNYMAGEPWNVGGRQRAATSKRNGSSSARTQNVPRNEESKGDQGQNVPRNEESKGKPPDQHDEELFDYRIRCDNGKVAVLRLPQLYSKADATRMTTIIEALARDEQPSVGTSDA